MHGRGINTGFHQVKGKRIILGISGGIAAYKAAFLIRLFKKAGAEVKVAGTDNAFEFITRVTFESLSENKVYDQVFGALNDYTTEHVALTDWGDVLVVAPATANCIGKFASGIADDALTTTFLAFDKQVFIAPAMNCKMYDHYATQKNLGYLRSEGVRVIEPGEGFLACGYEGRGRMEEPEEIFRQVESYLYPKPSQLAGKKVLVTAGPTQEAIDPVRFIGNHSSGRMGFAIANELAFRGAIVHLVSGPTEEQACQGVHLTKVVSANEMYKSVMALYPDMDLAVMAAAVADYRPEMSSETKIKKKEKQYSLRLVRTIDILASMGKQKTQQVLVGFALETGQETENALKKLKEKNLDYIVLNSLRDKGAGFGYESNKVSIIDYKGDIERYPLKSKKEVAADIADKLENHFAS